MIYISGPLSAPTPEQRLANIQAAVGVFQALTARNILTYCPHLSGLIPGVFDADHPISYEQWLAHCLEMLRRCNALYLLPKWEISSGTKRELALAFDLRLPIVQSLDAVDQLPEVVKFF